ncbi:hypothetical protein MTO96_022801 [Rhipicephalus appendiculatus]
MAHDAASNREFDDEKDGGGESDHSQFGTTTPGRSKRLLEFDSRALTEGAHRSGSNQEQDICSSLENPQNVEQVSRSSSETGRQAGASQRIV